MNSFWGVRVNRNVQVFLLSDVLYWTASAVVNAFLSILIVEKIAGGSLEAVGLVVAAYYFARAVSILPVSSLTKRLRAGLKIKFVSLSFISYGIVIASLSLVTDLWQIIIIQSLLGLLDAISYPLKWTAFTELLDRGEEEFEWGLEDFIPSVVSAIAAIGGGLISALFGLSFVFVVFGIFYSLSGVTYLLIKIKKGQRL